MLMLRKLWGARALVAALPLVMLGALAGCAVPTGTTTIVVIAPTPAGATPVGTQGTSATATPAGPATCQPNQLTLSIVTSQGAAGHQGEMDQFTNKSNTTCTLYGFPGAVLLDGAQHPLPTKAVWETDAYMYRNQQKTLVTLHPGGAAYFIVSWSDVTVGSETSCPTAAYLSVTPPNDFSVLTVADAITACGGGTLDISPVESTKPW
jgi:hypothetical protein